MICVRKRIFDAYDLNTGLATSGRVDEDRITAGQSVRAIGCI